MNNTISHLPLDGIADFLQSSVRTSTLLNQKICDTINCLRDNLAYS